MSQSSKITLSGSVRDSSPAVGDPSSQTLNDLIDISVDRNYPNTQSGKMTVAGTIPTPFDLPLGSVTAVRFIALKVLDGKSITVSVTSASGTDQVFPVSGEWLWESPKQGDELTSIQIVGTAEVEYIVAGDNSGGGGGGGAPTTAAYLVLAFSPALTQERVLTPGIGLTGTDGGPNAPYTLNVVLGQGDLASPCIITAAGGQSEYRGRRLDGTQLSPTHVLTNEPIAVFSAQGHDGTAFGAAGDLSFHAAVDWTLADHSTYAVLSLTKSLTSQQRLYVDPLSFGFGTVSPSANFHFVQPDYTSGAPVGLTFQGGLHTGLDAITDVNDVYFALGRTVQFLAGNKFSQEAIFIESPTYEFTAPSTIDQAATVYIGGAPGAGTNATLTTSAALLVGNDTPNGIAALAPGQVQVLAFDRTSFDAAAVLGGQFTVIANNGSLANGTVDGVWAGAFTTTFSGVAYSLVRGVRAQAGAQGGGNVATLTGVHSSVTGGTGGTIATAYGYLAEQAAGSATITRAYGLAVSQATGAITSWAGVAVAAPAAAGSGTMALLGTTTIPAGQHVIYAVAPVPSANLTASVEDNDVLLDLSRIVTFATGALSTQRAVLVKAPTYAFAGASHLTACATFGIDGPPALGANASSPGTSFEFGIIAGNMADLGVTGINSPNAGRTQIAAWDRQANNHSALTAGCFIQEANNTSGSGGSSFGLQGFAATATTHTTAYDALYGVSAGVKHQGSGTVGLAVGLNVVNFAIFGGGTITTAKGIDVTMAAVGATITTGIGVAVESGNGPTDFAGVAIDNQSGGVHNVHLMMGTLTVPASNYALYSVTTFPSLLSGKLIMSNSPFASFNVPLLGADPLVPASGDVWITDIGGVTNLCVRVGGTTKRALLSP